MTRPYSVKDALHRDSALSVVLEKTGSLYYLAVTNSKVPVEGYQISHQEVGTTSYYGYENKDGAWYIMKSVVAVAITTYTYTKGSSDYSTAWTNKGTQTYASFSTTFG